ncbi:MAG TPA: alpha/beta hydrolase [Parvibaculum sp.]|jgi:acetyl esterase/lipase
MNDPEIGAIRDFLANSGFSEDTAELRKAYDAMGDTFPTAADVIIEKIKANGVPAEWSSTPGAACDRVIMYMHGGGYVIGSIASHRHLVTELGRAAGTRALSLDYRLAPEHPFPAAVDDALAGYRFLLAEGFEPGNIAIAGDSAGGGLTVATLLAIREAGLPQPSMGFCISPWVDLEAIGNSMTTQAARDPMVQKEGLLGMAAAYLNGGSARNPLAAPIHANFTGLAPLLIQVGASETLLDDSTRLASVAGAADVEVNLQIWPEMIHVWHFFHPMLAAARRAILGAGETISKAMDRSVPVKKVAE